MNPLLIIIIGVVAIGLVSVSVVLPMLVEEKNELGTFEFRLAQNSFFNSDYVTCTTKSELFSIGNQGKIVLAKSPFFTSTPVVFYDITNRHDPGDVKDKFQIDLELKCDDKYKNSGEKITGSWIVEPTTISLFVTATDFDGSLINFKKITTPTKSFTLFDDTPVIIASFQISADSIEKAYTATVSPYNSHITFELSGPIKLNQGSRILQTARFINSINLR